MGVIKINNIIYGSNNSADIIYKNTTVEEKLNAIPVFDPSDNTNIEANQYDYLTYGHIVDTLNNSSSDKVLSANQGRVLNEKINNIDLSYLEDEIASLGTSIDELDINKANNDDVNTLTERVDNLHINSGYGRIHFKWDDSTGYLRAAVDNTENVVNLKGHVTVPFSFGVDTNGNYGYIKDGADTVTPFKTGKHDIILVGTGEINTNYTTKVGYCFPIYERGLITYSTNNVSWSAGATTNYITFTTNETALDILFMIDVQTTTTVCTPYITGADYILTGGNMVASGTKDNSYYRARLTNITGKVTVGCKLSYGAMYTMMLMTE